MVHRGIATLSGALMFCFLSLAQFDSAFFFLHFYEALIYLVIILMLFYFEDRWAYMLGMLAPAVWLMLSLLTNALPSAVLNLGRFIGGGEAPTNVALAMVLTSGLAILMIVLCARRWQREFSGLGKGWSTFGICLGAVLVYYGILVFWFGRLFPWQ